MPELQKSDVYADYSPGWRIIQTVPACELSLAETLRKRAICVYAPVYFETRSCGRGRVREIERPLVPGYIFVAVDPIRRVLEVPGAMDVVTLSNSRGDEELPAFLEDEDIEVFRVEEARIEVERQIWIARAARKGHSFRVGQPVRVPRLFADALVTRLDGKNKIRLLLQMFGRPTDVVVESHEIEEV